MGTKEKAKPSKWDNIDTEIEHTGQKITLPAQPSKMPYVKAIEAIQRKIDDENTIMDIREDFEGYPEDAMVAFNKAMVEMYGITSPTPRMTFFGPQAPDLVTIKTGPKDHEAIIVPFGDFTLPNIEKPISMHKTRNEDGMPMLVVTGKVRKKEQGFLRDLAVKTREILAERSIYKGKSIRLLVDRSGELELDRPPLFLETDQIKQDDLILNPNELSQVEASLWAPIMHTEACLKNQIPLNIGVLLEGKYGTGKTMSAHVTSKVCVDNGWTYILLDDVRGLKTALEFAQRYQPAVVFAEDIDRVVEIRDQTGNDILNTIDGVLTKSSQVITVMTTNYVEKIDKAMLRPGRLDSVISIKPPEKEAAQRLITLYGREMLDPKAELDEVSEILAGEIPATIREVVERAKRTALMYGRDKIETSDLITCAHGMEGHLALLNADKDEISIEEEFGQVFSKLVNNSTGDTSAIMHASEQVSSNVQHLSSTAGALAQRIGEVNETLESQANRAEKTYDNSIAIGKTVGAPVR